MQPGYFGDAGGPIHGQAAINTTTTTSSAKARIVGGVALADQFDFGLAIHALKSGAKVARTGWNGKGMWLILVPGTPQADLREGTPYAKALQQPSCEILPHIDMWAINADGRRAMLPGWLASQSDMLAEDWLIVE